MSRFESYGQLPPAIEKPVLFGFIKFINMTDELSIATVVTAFCTNALLFR